MPPELRRSNHRSPETAPRLGCLRPVNDARPSVQRLCAPHSLSVTEGAMERDPCIRETA